MILRTLTLCLGLGFAGSAGADTCDDLPSTYAEGESVQRVSASEAFQRSEGQIVFMDAGNIRASLVSLAWDSLYSFFEQTGVCFEMLHVSPDDTDAQSFLCYNAQGCYPVTLTNFSRSMAHIGDFAQDHGLVID